MGAKGRKRKALRKAKNRTGMIKSISGFHSSNQRAKRESLSRMKEEQSEAYKRYFNL